MPSIQSAAEQWTSDNPDLAAFLAGADYAQGIPTDQTALLTSSPTSTPARRA